MLPDLFLSTQTVLFDSDGVLVDSDETMVHAWSTWAIAWRLEPAQVLAFIHGRPARDAVATFLPPEYVAAALAEIDRLELGGANSVHAVPGALDLVERLPNGRWAIVTSASRTLARARLAAAGIPAPPVLVTADDVSYGKPHPDGYSLALRLLDVDPCVSIVIEDTATGISAALAAGVKTVVGVSPRSLDAGAIASVRDLRALSWQGVLRVAACGRIA